MYENGRYVPQDFKLAYKWHNKAAKQKLDCAQFSLVTLFRDGKGVEHDVRKTKQYFELKILEIKSGDQGFADSLNILYGKSYRKPV